MMHEKKRASSRLNYKLCFMVVLIVYISIAIIGQQSKINALNSEIQSTNELIDQKNSEISLLEDQQKLYESSEFIERVARERLGFVRSDETVFVDVTGK